MYDLHRSKTCDLLHTGHNINMLQPLSEMGDKSLIIYHIVFLVTCLQHAEN